MPLLPCARALRTGPSSISTGLALLASLALLGLAGTAAADQPDGVFVFEGGGLASIVDFGAWQECVDDSGITLCLDLDVVADAGGGYSGMAELDFSGLISGVLTGPVSGKVSGKGKTGAAKFKIAFATQGDLTTTVLGSSQTFASEISGKISGQAQMPSTGIIAKGNLKVKLAGLGSESAKFEFVTQGVGGAWTLTLDLSPVDDVLVDGMATASINGETYQIPLSGKYSEKKDETKLGKAKGSPKTGASIKIKGLETSGSNVDGIQIKYGLGGFKGTLGPESID